MKKAFYTEVEDYDYWFTRFMNRQDLLKELGANILEIFRCEEYPNTVMIVFEGEDFTKFDDFLQSPEVLKEWESRGVIIEAVRLFKQESTVKL